MKKELLFIVQYFNKDFIRADDVIHTVNAFKKYFNVKILIVSKFKTFCPYQSLKLIKQRIDKINPEIIFFINPEAYPFYTDKFLSYLKKKYFLINWSCDHELYRTSNLFFNQYADFILSHAPWEIHKSIKKSQYNYLFNGNYKINKINLKKTIDVITIGTMNKSKRMELTNYLKNNGINIFDYGPGSTNGILSRKNYFKKINQSKIAVRFSGRDINKNIHPLRIDPQSRFIKTQTVGINDYLSCGTFLLCEKMFLEKKVKQNKHLVFFKSKKDLLHKVKYYLKNVKKREIIENTGFRLFLKEYQEKKLIKHIAHKIHKRIEKKSHFKNYKINLFTRIYYIKIFNNYQILNLNFKYSNLNSIFNFIFELLKYPYFSYLQAVRLFIQKIKKVLI